MLQRLVTTAIVLAIAYLLLTKALPWIRDELSPTAVDSESVAGGDDGYCIQRASNASDAVARAARHFASPPVDEAQWSDTAWEIESEIADAAAACRCASPACDTASRAVSEIRDLQAQLDALVRGQPEGYANLGRHQERIHQLLDEARRAAR